MSVSANRIVSFMNLGVQGVEAPAPDGLFAAEQSIASDATGGTAVLDLILGASNEERPQDIMMKLSWAVLTQVGPQNMVMGSIRLVANLPFPTQGQDVRLAAAISTALSLTFDPAQGMWFFPQKGTTFFLRGVADNPIAGNTLFFACQGQYWYMGRLRRNAYAMGL